MPARDEFTAAMEKAFASRSDTGAGRGAAGPPGAGTQQSAGHVRPRAVAGWAGGSGAGAVRGAAFRGQCGPCGSEGLEFRSWHVA